MFRSKIYQNLYEIQQDVDCWMTFYNKERPHSGKHCYGKIPWQSWMDGRVLTKGRQFDHFFIPADSQSPPKSILVKP
ncbi:hypothetical protein C8R11_112102 [Nitrosomonas aestuarii]|nr:hypothetical protein C8R11_112102 [Nitrosomonas aestuarii]